MARLPSERYVMQQESGVVRLFEDYTGRVIAWFCPDNGFLAGQFLTAVSNSELGDEDRCFACFWAGYFHAHARPDPGSAMARPPAITRADDGIVLVTDGPHIIASFDPASADAAAKAQKAIYDSGLAPAVKRLAHFWSGYFYAQAGRSDPETDLRDRAPDRGRLAGEG